MNKFFTALTTKDLLTENGMPTHSTSGSFPVDFFYKMGGVRAGRESLSQFVGLFYASFAENPNLTLRALFNLRDVRGGMGERDVFKILLNSLAKTKPELVKKFVNKIPEYGRWDDLFALLDTPVEQTALEVILTGLRSGDSLCGKWMPRENKSEGHIAKYLMQKFGMSAPEYRHAIVEVTKSGGSTVETQMCQKLWEKIKFESVPSQAMKKYRKAFGKHQQERFADYLKRVEKGEVKINTGTLSPVELVRAYTTGSSSLFLKNLVEDDLEVMWNNLKDVVLDEISFLPVPDTSGSMTWNGGLPFLVASSLSIYLGQRNKSIFKNGLITFSQRPTFVKLTGRNLLENLQQYWRADVGGNTNLEAVFDLILTKAIQAELRPEDMPTHIMIFSDMQFDSAVRFPRDSVMEMISKKYRAAGYERPNIFFWNVSNAGGVPAKVDENGVALVSGFSPNLLRMVLSGDVSPLRQVEAILNVPRYDFVNEVLG